MTRDCGFNDETSTLGFRRKRAPIGGWLARLVLPGFAICDAGQRYWLRMIALGSVNRSAWRMMPSPPCDTGSPPAGRATPGNIAHPAASAEVQPSVRKLFVFISQIVSLSACHWPSAFSDGREAR